MKCVTHITDSTFRSRRVIKSPMNEGKKERIPDKDEAATNESDTKPDVLTPIFCDQFIISSQEDSNSDDDDEHKDLLGRETNSVSKHIESNTESDVDLKSDTSASCQGCNTMCHNTDESWQVSPSVPYRYVHC